MKNVGFGDLAAATMALLKADIIAVFAFIALLTGAWVAADFLVDQPAMTGLFTLAALAVSIFGQSILTRRLLSKSGVASVVAMQDGRYAAVLGIVLLTGLGILGGFILLIIPGLILMVRWFMSVPSMLAENLSVTDGIRASWTTSTHHVGSIFALILVTAVPVILASIYIVVWGSDDAVIPPLESFWVNLSIASTTVLGWVGATACYTTIHGGQNRISEIFG